MRPRPGATMPARTIRAPLARLDPDPASPQIPSTPERAVGPGRADRYGIISSAAKIPHPHTHHGPLAQLAEQLTLNQPVLGSSPRGLTSKSSSLSERPFHPGTAYLMFDPLF